MRAGLARTFARTATGYAATVLPTVSRELARWRERAAAIPDPVMRGQALEALGKEGNMRGAALFAVFAPRAARGQAVRALVAFQAAYNYLDMLAEQPSEDPEANGRRLHEALLVALDPGAEHGEPYALHPRHEDGRYLATMVDACRDELHRLPSYGLVHDAMARSARRIVEFQSLNLGEGQGEIEGLRRWGERWTPPHSGLAWWETAAAGGSSLGVHVLAGMAGDPTLEAHTVAAVEHAYFPWVGAFHSLLDSTVDVLEDERDGQRNLLSYYPSQAHAARRLGELAQRACAEAGALPDHHRHEAVIAAMSGHYLSAPQASRAVADSVTEATGGLLGSTVALMRLGRRANSAFARAA